METHKDVILRSESKLTKKDINKSMWIYYAGAELSNSYERLQSLVFCASMTPILKKLYSTDEELSEALKRHLVFFNTEGIFGSIIQGITIAMEEEKSLGEKIDSNAINGIKTGLMGPIAGMGDSIIWAALMPIIISIFLPFANNGSAIGGIMPLILYPLITILISYFLIHNGYTLGKKSVVTLMRTGSMKQIIFTANVIGLIMMGALSASYISLTTPLKFNFSGGTTIVIQEILDTIAPNLLSLATVFIIYGYIKKRGPQYTKILISIVLVSIITSVLGLF
ncbi:PTS system mannose/fructose/sorbose family transporter subunit IID [Schnuerera sp. xch1]|uniref:PTS system mannose/fructose/sorbose family transporter subunit IID n=1 Tax=Schnuerera sp. xch1 TaxID=2874283 RepID=UPI001CBF8102|nr:PTS system mannose/fructose/sorbose family transporter subunit IID [Schnuerera sp. xch1]MBZ2175996.1 PTS system mannose/fructose/sorbose family transporter subunit IID [Schnuerera sp. xch1]